MPLAVQFSGNKPVSASTISIPPGETFVVSTEYNPDAEPIAGWGRMDVPCTITSSSVFCGDVAAVVTLKNRNSTRPDFEAVLPAKEAVSHTALLVDNRKDNETVLMLVNDSTFLSPISFKVVCKDSKGTTVLIDQITMSQNASLIFNLKERWPSLQDFVVRVEFSSSTATVVLTAIRINPTNSFTPIPTFEY